MKELITIGKILKTHGLKGHIKVFIDSAYMNDLEDSLESFFIGGLPFFISAKDINTDEQAILLLEDTDTKELAQKLCGKDIQVPADQLKVVYEAEQYNEWIGFSVSDRQRGELGKVTDIIEMPHQVLLQVMYEKRAVMIPLNDELVPLIDPKKKTIQTNLPEGFLDIF